MKYIKLLLILTTILLVCLSFTSYMLYNKVNTMRDYFINKLHENENLTKEKFDNLIDNIKDIVYKKKEVLKNEEKQIIDQLYSDLENINENELEYDTLPTLKGINIVRDDLTIIDNIKVKDEKVINKNVEDDFKDYVINDKLNLQTIEEENDNEESEEVDEDDEEEVDADIDEDDEEEVDEEEVDEEEVDEEEVDEEEVDEEEDVNNEEIKEKKCLYVYRRGKNKGAQCEEMTIDDFCKKHTK